MNYEEIDQLAASAKAGDANAFEELVTMLIPFLWHLFLKSGLNREEVEELVQETWFRVCERIHQYKTELSFIPWLKAIARNLRADHFRSKRNDRSFDEGDFSDRGGERPSEPLDKAFTNRALFECVMQLPPEDREMILQRYYVGKSLKVFAAEQELDYVRTKARIYRVRENIRKCLENKGVTEI